MTETINGLLSVKPGNEPQQGEIRNFVIEARKSNKTGEEYWKIKHTSPDYVVP